ncbi:MAG: hypothetical protein KKB59_19390, partial [Spirochaetes bacterium]|nr:hypothetical protein [Spirochaetota bacterium]
SPELEKLLRPMASTINSAFTEFRTPRGNLDGEVFSKCLVGFGESFVLGEEVQNKNERVMELVRGLLELQSRDLLGQEERYPGLTQQLIRLSRAFPQALVSNPKRFLGAFWNLGTKTQLDRLIALPRIKSLGLADLMSLGLIAAWTGGLTAFRSAALERLQAGELPGYRSLLAKTEVEEERLQKLSWEQILTALQERQWCRPGLEVRTFLQWTGGFSGFEHEFSQLPLLVGKDEEALVVLSGDDTWSLVSDAWGMGLIHLEKKPATSPQQKEKRQMVELPEALQSELVKRGILIDSISSSLWLGQTLVWTSHLSYKIFQYIF